MKKILFGLALLISSLGLRGMHEYTPILREQINTAFTKYESGPHYWVIHNKIDDEYYGEIPFKPGKYIKIQGPTSPAIQARLKAYYLHLKKQYDEQYYQYR